MTSKRQFQFVATLLVFLAGTAACHGFSCGPQDDHFYLQCSNTDCGKAFRARDIPFALGGPCGRRLVVAEVPAGATAALRQLVAARGVSLPRAGIYHVSLWEHPSRTAPEAPEALAHLLRELAHEDPNHEQVRDVQIRAIESLPGGADFERIRSSWLERAQRDTVWVWALDAVNALGLAVLAYTAARFRRACLAAAPQASRRARPSTYVAVQIGLLVLSQFTYFYLFSLASLVVLLYEAILYTDVGLKRARARQA